jgi:hypothetical protein
MMSTTPRLCALALALTLARAHAQPADDSMMLLAEAGPLAAGTHMLVGEGDTLAFAAGELGRERVVKGAPYCADAEQESVQPLADGNRIVRKQTTRLCRDGEGRTRQEVDRGGRKIVYLRDPRARESWVLDPQRKTARRLGSAWSGHPMPDPDESAWREYGEKMREWAKDLRERSQRDAVAVVPPVPPVPPVAGIPAAPPVPVVIAEDERQVRDAQGRPEFDWQRQVLRLYMPHPPMPRVPGIVNMPNLPPMLSPLPPGVAMRAQLGAPRGPGVATPLGSKEIEGLKVNGERTTWTIEAGKVGNEKPILITRDVWTSPELMLTVLSRDADPRVGETTYRLARVKRGEPDAALMRVPADYATNKPAPKASSGPGSKG